MQPALFYLLMDPESLDFCRFELNKSLAFEINADRIFTKFACFFNEVTYFWIFFLFAFLIF